MKRYLIALFFEIGVVLMSCANGSNGGSLTNDRDDDINSLVQNVKKTLPTTRRFDEMSINDIKKDKKSITIEMKIYESYPDDVWKKRMGTERLNEQSIRQNYVNKMINEDFMAGYEQAIEDSEEWRDKQFYKTIGPLLKAMVRNKLGLNIKLVDTNNHESILYLTTQEVELGVMRIEYDE